MCRNKTIPAIAMFVFGILLLAACRKETVYVETKEPPLPGLLQSIQNNFTFTIFYAALKKTGLDKTLNDKDTLTVLVPDNKAFEEIGIRSASDLDRLNIDSLKKAIAYHILPQRILSKDIPKALDNEYRNLAGDVLYFSKQIDYNYTIPLDTTGHVNGAHFKYLDNRTKNGVIHVINKPLKPTAPSVKAILEADTSFSYFSAALKKFGLYEQLSGEGPFTVLAPVNEAFRQQGISPDSIARMDPSQYKDLLFSVYILSPNRIFVSDFVEALPKKYWGTYDSKPYNYIFYPECVILFEPNYDYTTLATGARMSVWPYENPNGGFLFPYGGGFSIFTNLDNVAANGVVHGLDALAVFPGDVLK